MEITNLTGILSIVFPSQTLKAIESDEKFSTSNNTELKAFRKPSFPG